MTLGIWCMPLQTQDWIWRLYALPVRWKWRCCLAYTLHSWCEWMWWPSPLYSSHCLLMGCTKTQWFLYLLLLVLILGLINVSLRPVTETLWMSMQMTTLDFHYVLRLTGKITFKLEVFFDIVDSSNAKMDYSFRNQLPQFVITTETATTTRHITVRVMTEENHGGGTPNIGAISTKEP